MFKFHFDWLIILPALLLLIISLTIIRSIAPQLFTAQLGFIAISVIVFFLVSAVDYEIIYSFHLLGYLALLVMTISLPFLGVLSRGATRWVQIGNFSLQPSELIKPFLLLTLSYFSANLTSKRSLWLFLFGFIPILIIFFQPDLGTSVVLFVGWASLILSQVNLKTLLILILAMAFLALPFYRFVLKDYQRQRLITFTHPYSDPLGQGYHIIQSVIAVGSGEIFGRGLGHGTQTQLRFLPEHHTDFIFSSISEELGFIGSMLTILLYITLLYRIFCISQDVVDPKAALFCLASLAMFGFQIFINIGMNLGIAPITGITLPLLSYGGSSLLSTAILLGIVTSISKTARFSAVMVIH
jgi:rod shape determining protein RodA